MVFAQNSQWVPSCLWALSPLYHSRHGELTMPFLPTATISSSTLLNGSTRVDVCLRWFPVPATIAHKEASHGKVDLGLEDTDKHCPWHRPSCSKVKLACLNPRARSGLLLWIKHYWNTVVLTQLLWPIATFMLKSNWVVLDKAAWKQNLVYLLSCLLWKVSHPLS